MLRAFCLSGCAVAMAFSVCGTCIRSVISRFGEGFKRSLFVSYCIGVNARLRVGGGLFTAVQLTYRRWTERARLGVGKHHKKSFSFRVGFIFCVRYTTSKEDRAARNNNNKSGNTAVVVKTNRPGCDSATKCF